MAALSSYFCAVSPGVVCSEYVLGADGGTGHEEHAYREKAVIAIIVKRTSRFIWPRNSVE